MCDTLLHCTLHVLTEGWRNGDIASAMDPNNYQEDGNYKWGSRIFFDLIFFLVVGLILSNIVSGIILDTFGALRQETNERSRKFLNECFITGLERHKFDEAGVDFVTHRSLNPRATNHIWNYGVYDVK